MVAAEAFEAADLTLQGELNLETFLEALTDPRVAEKVSQATCVPVDWFLSLSADEIVELFRDIDADANGSITFSEWVTGLLRVRKANYEDCERA